MPDAQCGFPRRGGVRGHSILFDTLGILTSRSLPMLFRIPAPGVPANFYYDEMDANNYDEMGRLLESGFVEDVALTRRGLTGHN